MWRRRHGYERSRRQCPGHGRRPALQAATEPSQARSTHFGEPGPGTAAKRLYGRISCGGITDGHWLGGVRSGFAGPGVLSPWASVSSAAREQLPPGMFHQFDVIGYAAVYEVGSCAAMQL